MLLFRVFLGKVFAADALSFSLKLWSVMDVLLLYGSKSRAADRNNNDEDEDDGASAGAAGDDESRIEDEK